MDAVAAEALARRFHEAYERLAPSFGYETRKETREFDRTTPNGQLMIAVCAAIMEPHPDFKERVKLEKAELDERINKLTRFKNSDTFLTLPPAEQHRMGWQLSGMTEYSRALNARILAFT